MRDFPEVLQDENSGGLVLRDRTGTRWKVVMDWSGPYPMILVLDKRPWDSPVPETVS